MGMSIDEAIKQINECKAYKQCDMEKDSEAFEYAIDTMRKYQQIVQIMERTVDDGTSMYDTLQEIEEVIYENE